VIEQRDMAERKAGAFQGNEGHDENLPG
jgi:hypothetical protein